MRTDVKKRKKIPVDIEYTEGYEKRFTAAILEIYAKRQRAAVETIEKESKAAV